MKDKNMKDKNMKDKNMKDKNIIVGDINHIFTQLYIDTLINKCNINPNCFCFISLNNHSINSHNFNYDVYHHELCSLDEMKDCRTITAISLHKGNAFFLEKLFALDELVDKTYIHLTDDEVSRWNNTIEEKGSLLPSKSNLIDESCLHVLNKVRNFISPEPYFKEKLTLILQRDDFNFYDCRDPFKSLPSTLWNKFEDLYYQTPRHTNPENKILIGPKKGVFSLKETILILQALRHEGLLPKLRCMIFTHKNKMTFRILLDIYLLYVRRRHNIKIDLSYPSRTNSITYNALLMSCSHIILQGRGSMSSARSYLSLGRGVIHIKYNTPNDIELRESEGVDVASYDSFKDLASNVKNNRIDIISNNVKIQARYQSKYNTLRNIYSQ